MVGWDGWADDQSESGSSLLDAGKLWNLTGSFFAFVGVFRGVLHPCSTFCVDAQLPPKA